MAITEAAEYAALYLRNVHEQEECDGPPCAIHHPSAHHMAGWPIQWRNDRGIWERVCPHGIGHPDPDQGCEGTHGCDGCCTPDGTQEGR
jgi:hypothetical protein